VPMEKAHLRGSFWPEVAFSTTIDLPACWLDLGPRREEGDAPH